MSVSRSLTAVQEQAASRIDALDLDPVVFGLMHPDPGLTVMGLAEADQVVAAYRAWLKLCAWYPGEPLVPAVPVDEAWQAHLADTAKYARDCQEAFGTFAHRYPYHWRDASWVAWHRDYARTCDLFREHFGTGMPGTAPPADEDFHPDAECCTGGAGSIRVFGDLADPGATVLGRERPRLPRGAVVGYTGLPALAGRTVLPGRGTREVDAGSAVPLPRTRNQWIRSDRHQPQAAGRGRPGCPAPVRSDPVITKPRMQSGSSRQGSTDFPW